MYHKGFTLIEKGIIDEIDSEGLYFVHNKTKAKIIFLKNQDKHRVFMVGFHTPVHDATGISHVIEHGVLSGSKNYPSDRAFLEISKSSVNSFMNAVTFEDSTYYFMSSYLKDEFDKLSDVYMDFVYHSNLMQNEDIFYEARGYHSEEKQLNNGVVYNEMKGVYGNILSFIQRKSQFSLFPNGCYGFDYGGEPEQILELSYDAAKKYYKKFYTPDNSYLYFYGDIDVEEKLGWIEKYYGDVEVEIEEHSTKEELTDIKKYQKFSYHGRENRGVHVTYNVVINREKGIYQNEKIFAVSYLLKQRIKEWIEDGGESEGLCEDVEIWMNTSIRDKVVTIVFLNCKKEKSLSEIEAVIDHMLSEILCQGFSENDIQRVLKDMVFTHSIEDSNESTTRIRKGFQIMSELRYSDSQVFDSLREKEHLEMLLKENQPKDYEHILECDILHNPHKTICLFQHEEQKANAKVAANVEKEIQINFHRETGEKVFLPSQNSKEIPYVKRNVDYYTKQIEDVKIVYHLDKKTNISYFHLLFELDEMQPEEYSKISILSMILGQIDTSECTYRQLQQESLKNVETNVAVFDKDSVQEKCAYFDISAVIVDNDLERAFSLIEQVLWNSVFSDVKRVRSLIMESFLMLRNRIYATQPQTVAVERALSSFSGASFINDCLAGISCYEFLEKVLRYDEPEFISFVQELESLYKGVFCANRLTVFYAGNEESREFEKAILAMKKKANKAVLQKNEMISLEHVELRNKKIEGIPIDSEVQYVAIGVLVNMKNIKNYGAFLVAKSLIEEMYLWTNLREMRGVYGFMCEFRENGKAYFVSYRDPNLYATWEVFMNIPKFLKICEITDQELEMIKIGVLGKRNKSKGFYEEANDALANYIKGSSDLKQEEIYRQVADTEIRDIREVGRLLTDDFKDVAACALGNERIIEQELLKIKNKYKG